MKDNLILHIDGDAFFASCEISRRPDLRGKPVVVGEEKGIAAAYSYEAKSLGIYRGMPVFKIRKDYPTVCIISSHFELYQEFKNKLITILRESLSIVEPYSIDECFAILPNIPREKLKIFVQNLKKKIQESLGITYSFGIAKTKTLSKLASKLRKPDGLVFLTSEREVSQALKATSTGSIWGIGRKLSALLLGQNIRTAEEFINMPVSKIESLFALPAVETYHELRGIKIFEVNETHDNQKTIQATHSLERATGDSTLLFSELSRNVETACIHLREAGLLTNTAHAFYRHAYDGKHRESGGVLLPIYTDDPTIILKFLEPLAKRIFVQGKRYKSTGLTLLNLKKESNIQDDLFGAQKLHTKNKSHLEVIDSLNRRFGEWTVMRASSLQSVLKRRKESALRDSKDNYEYGLPLPYMGEVY